MVIRFVLIEGHWFSKSDFDPFCLFTALSVLASHKVVVLCVHSKYV